MSGGPEGRDRGPKPADEWAAKALRDMAGPEREGLIEVLRVWRQCVGDRIAQVARPKRLAGGTLNVAVASPVWSQQLLMMAPELIQTINDALGKEMVCELRFSPASEARR